MIKMLHVFLLLCVLLPMNAHAQNDKPGSSVLQNIPVQHEGRLKPLDSFAQIHLEQLSSQTSIGELSAMDWLALTLFDPQNAALIKVIRIENENVRHKMQLPDGQEFFNLEDLSKGVQQTQADVITLLEKPANTLSEDEKALISAHEKAATLIALMRSFSGTLPLNIQLPEKYAAQIAGPPSFMNLMEIEEKLQEDVKAIVLQKGANPANFSPEEAATAETGYNLQTLRMAGQTNKLLRVIPAAEENNEQWVSPWMAVLNREDSQAAEFLLSMWSDLAQSYRDNDTEQWDIIASELLTETKLQAATTIPEKRFAIERIYRTAKPYLWITLLYTAISIMALFSLKGSIAPALNKISAPLTGATIIAHASVIAARIYILDRPPVGTLYESILFVSVIAALAGLIMHIKKSNPLALFAGTFSALLLLLSAPFFEPDGDNLEVLVAVLNTGFWLTTHVLIITAGYGLCVIAAVLAHAALALKPEQAALRMTLQNNVYKLSLFALLFTAVGTVLGGIWADQSWGRFWGWDPKENGALLIVLWLIWVQHGRVSNRFKPPMFLALIACLNIVVAVSWFGVNLLNVGLHSYGFTSGMAEALLTFCVLETLLISALYWRHKKQQVAA